MHRRLPRLATLLAALLLPVAGHAALSRGAWVDLTQLVVPNLLPTPECQAFAGKFSAVLRDETLSEKVLNERMLALSRAAKRCTRDEPTVSPPKVTAPVAERAAKGSAVPVAERADKGPAVPIAKAAMVPVVSPVVAATPAAAAAAPSAPPAAVAPSAPPAVAAEPAVSARESAGATLAAGAAQARDIAAHASSTAAGSANDALARTVAAEAGRASDPQGTFLGYALLGLFGGLIVCAVVVTAFLLGLAIGFGYPAWRKRRAARHAPPVEEEEEERGLGSRASAPRGSTKAGPVTRPR